MKAQPGGGENLANLLESPTLRTIASLLLFIHLFVVGLGIALNFRPRSQLIEYLVSETDLNDSLLVYSRALNMDLAYDYHLANGAASDVDHVIEIELGPAAAGGETREIRFPSPQIRPGQRFERYQRLANRIGNPPDEQTALALARSIVLRTMTEHGVDRATIRCRGHLFLSQSDSATGVDPNGPGFWNPAFSAGARLVDGELAFVVQAEPLELAPAPDGDAGEGDAARADP